jgi:RNA polymerase sigma-70 factor (ECF subfamily)
MNKELFARIFDAEYDYVYASLRRLGVQLRDLEDLAHDVFVAVYANLGRYDPSRPVRPWLFAFAFRFASDYRRLARHRTTLDVDTDLVPAPGPSAEEEAMDREALRTVERALDAIPLDHRGVFVMYEIDEIPMKEIAENLGILLNTAYSRLRLARAAFSEAVAKTRGPVGP